LFDQPIIPIRIPTPFAVGDVYSYLIHDEKIVLVDCGHKAENAFERIKKELHKLNLGVADIDEIWLTHGHPDHFGQAARLADESGATVYGHIKERANFAGNDDGELFEEFFSRRGIPKEHRELMVEQLDWLQQFQMPLQPTWIEEGAVLSSGNLSFEVKHTPGHAPGHLTFFSDEILFSGDVLLEHISTNALINFDPDTGERNKSLMQYRESLNWIRQQSGVVLPGHGKFISNIEQVAARHMGEHQKRYRLILRLLQRRPRTLFELALELFPDAIKKKAIFLVLSEVMGYLDWGMEEGVIGSENDTFKRVN